MRIVALAGLPGTGKSALARELSELLAAPVFDKDRLREALFGADVDYSSEQNDRAVRATYAAAQALARAGGELAILDGRTYSRAAQVAELRRFVAGVGAELVLVECVCRPEIARERLERDRREGRHPAADRGVELYERLRAAAQPIEGEKHVLDTSNETPATLARRLIETWLRDS